MGFKFKRNEFKKKVEEHKEYWRRQEEEEIEQKLREEQEREIREREIREREIREREIREREEIEQRENQTAIEAQQREEDQEEEKKRESEEDLVTTEQTELEKESETGDCVVDIPPETEQAPATPPEIDPSRVEESEPLLLHSGYHQERTTSLSRNNRRFSESSLKRNE